MQHFPRLTTRLTRYCTAPSSKAPLVRRGRRAAAARTLGPAPDPRAGPGAVPALRRDGDQARPLSHGRLRRRPHDLLRHPLARVPVDLGKHPVLGHPRWSALRDAAAAAQMSAQAALDGPFSAAPKPTFSTKYPCCIFFEIYMICTLLHRSRLKFLVDFSGISTKKQSILVNIQQHCAKLLRIQ